MSLLRTEPTLMNAPLAPRCSPPSNWRRATRSSASPRPLTPTPIRSKVNLGVGVYYDDNGKMPLLECVKRAEREIADKAAPRGYLPIDGIPAYDKAVQGAAVRRRQRDRHVAAAPSPCRRWAAPAPQGRRRFPAPLRARRAGLHQRPELGEPSRAVRRRRLRRPHYPYYDAATHGLDFDGMLARSSRCRAGRSSCCMRAATIPPASIPTAAQWTEILDVVRARGLLPFLDIAYQGFADGIDADGAVVRRFAATPGPLFVVELVLQVVLALRRARRRAVHRGLEQATKPRACCRR